MNKITNKIHNNFYSRFPERVKMEVGCLLENKITGLKGKIVNTHFNSVDIYWYDTDNFGAYSFEEVEERFKLLGRFLTITDILRWLDKISKSYEYYSVSEENGLVLNTRYEPNRVERTSLLIKWDFNSPYLDDQSDEIINKLHKFIKNEKSCGNIGKDRLG